MRCPQCDGELKATAIYCHRCGLRLVSQRQPVAVADLLDEEASAESVPAADAFADTAPSTPDEPDAVPESVSVEPSSSQDENGDIAAAETREFMLEGLRLDVPALEPLAPGTLVAQRYQIERLAQSDATGHLYDVRDLQATSHCWACEASWSADDQFCSACGAARRGERLVLREEPAHPERIAALQYSADAQIIEGDRLYLFEGEIEGEGSEDSTFVSPPADVVTSGTEPQKLGALTADSLGAGQWVTDLQEVLRDQNEAPTIEAQFFPSPMPRTGTIALPRITRTPAPRIHVGMLSDVGRARSNKPNEDTALTLTLTHGGDQPPAPLTLCLVADGLGGHDDGQRAGRLAARIIATHIIQAIWLPALEGQHARTYDPVALGDALRGGILEANARIVATNILEGGDMGCTVTAFVAQGDAACIANVGDSRTYHFDGRELKRVTVDHSLVARLVSANMLDPEDVYTHPQRSQIYRSLGDDADLQVDLFPRRLKDGDCFILCSDGLWEMVRDPGIAQVAATCVALGPQSVAEQLVQVANEHGGEDNVSVVVAQVVA